MRVLGVIPARGGSKGIERKNVRELHGEPLIAYSIRAALGSEKLSRSILSTDNDEIAAIGRDLGIDVPFKRPAHLATDEALSIDVALHALDQEERNGLRYDALVLLQPTAPLRSSGDIDAAIGLMTASGSDSVISISEVTSHPFWMKRLLPDGTVISFIDVGFEDMRPRQMLPKVYVRNGAIYLARRDVVVGRHTFVGDDCRGYVMPPERSVNIDAESDLALAEYWLSRVHGAARSG